MGRTKIPDHMLTEEQLKRRRRNEKHRNKVIDISKKTSQKQSQKQSQIKETKIKDAEIINKLIETVKETVKNDNVGASQKCVSNNVSETLNETVKNDQIETTNDFKEIKMKVNEWIVFNVTYRKPQVFFSLLLILAVTSLLVIFQYQAYISSGYSVIISSLIAVITELCLIFLTIIYSVSKSKISAILFITTAAYSLCFMSLDIKDNEASQMSASQKNDETYQNLSKSLSQTQKALEIATKRRESGNMSKYSKQVTELTQLLASQKTNETVSNVIKYRSSSLIVLRALLMCILALVIHITILIVSKNNIK